MIYYNKYDQSMVVSGGRYEFDLLCTSRFQVSEIGDTGIYNYDDGLEYSDRYVVSIYPKKTQSGVRVYSIILEYYLNADNWLRTSTRDRCEISVHTLGELEEMIELNTVWDNLKCVDGSEEVAWIVRLLPCMIDKYMKLRNIIR